MATELVREDFINGVDVRHLSDDDYEDHVYDLECKARAEADADDAATDDHMDYVRDCMRFDD